MESESEIREEAIEAEVVSGQTGRYAAAHVVATPEVVTLDGTVYVSSLNLAAVFRKRHDAVLHSIRTILSRFPEKFQQCWVKKDYYTTSRGHRCPAYFITAEVVFPLLYLYSSTNAVDEISSYIIKISNASKEA